MPDDEIGYGRPPKHSQFSPGQSGNPNGRPPKTLDRLADAVGKVMDTPVQYKERGRTKTTSRRELRLRQLVQRALAGDVAAAEALLRERHRASRQAGGPQKVLITDWLPDHPGQTADQKVALTAGAHHKRSKGAGKEIEGAGQRHAPEEVPEELP